MKWHRDHVEWGQVDTKEDGTPYYQYYFYYKPNWLEKKYRYLGYRSMYYDGPHASFGFWYFNFSWSTQWTRVDLL